jgi:mRNA interferase MazF
MSPLRGEVWMADTGMAGKIRPVIIISRDDSDPPRNLAIYVPITGQNRQSKYEVVLPGLPFLVPGSVANTQGVASLPVPKFQRKLGDLPRDALVQVEQALLFAVGIAT